MKLKYLGINLGLLICAALTPWGAKADWLNLTGAETAPNIAEIYVQDDRVRLVFESTSATSTFFPTSFRMTG